MSSTTSSNKNKLYDIINIKFFMQNIRKSRALVLLLSLGVVLINAISIVYMNSTSNNTSMLSTEDISYLNIVFLYVYPFALSFVLFGFLFKKKSVDFVCSLPISRVSLFVTNTIGGIVIIVAEMILNVVVTGVFVAASDTYMITFEVLLDYFVAWTIYFILFFVLGNLALSLAGNAVTGIVLIMLFLFLIPTFQGYAYSYIGHGYQNDEEGYLQIYSRDERNLYEQDNGSYEAEVNKNNVFISKRTTPVNIINALYYGYDYRIFSPKELIGSVFAIIIYIILGYVAYCKRRMEVCETSFRSDNLHCIVKALTIIPMLCILSMINNSDMIGLFLILLTMLIIYYFIYDLVTKRTLAKLKYSVIYFGAAVVFVFTLGLILKFIEKNVDDTRQINFALEDVEAVTLYADEEYKDYYIYDKDYIQYVLKLITNNDVKDDEMFTMAKLKIKSEGTLSGLSVSINEDEFNELQSIIKKNKIKADVKEKYLESIKAVCVKKYSKNTVDVDEFKKEFLKDDYDLDIIADGFEVQQAYSSNYAAYSSEYDYVFDNEYGSEIYYRKSDGLKCYYDAGEDQFYSLDENGDKAYIEYENDYSDSNVSSNGFGERDYVNVYRYINHKMFKTVMYANSNNYIAEICSEVYNAETVQYAPKIDVADIAIMNILNVANTGDVNSLINSLLMLNKKDIMDYIVEHADDKVNVEDSYCILEFQYTKDNDTSEFKGYHDFYFVVNDTEEFAEFIMDLYKKSSNNISDEAVIEEQNKLMDRAIELIKQGYTFDSKGGI